LNEDMQQLRITYKQEGTRQDIDFMFANLRFICSFPTFLKLMEFKNKMNEEPNFD